MLVYYRRLIYILNKIIEEIYIFSEHEESMEAESKENIGLFAALHNNIYVMKLGSELSTSRVIHALFMKILYYFDWIFLMHIF